MKKEKKQLSDMYENLQDKLSDLYDQGSPAIETTAAEAKLEQLQEVMKIFNVPFSE